MKTFSNYSFAMKRKNEEAGNNVSALVSDHIGKYMGRVRYGIGMIDASQAEPVVKKIYTPRMDCVVILPILSKKIPMEISGVPRHPHFV
jgi:hypothetical protein